ncbi:MAG: hypothetical protein NTX53_13880 [candidate division WOR-3 bacterium]|nr:hypothetical protein [candidate division WOR-3 bacterium]
MIPARRRLFAILTVLGLITAPGVLARPIDTLWTSHWGWPTGGQTVATGVVRDNQGNLFTCGSTDSVGDGTYKVFLTKGLSRKDSVYWRHTYGGSTGASQGFSVKSTPDNGILIAGMSNSFSEDHRDQAYLIKTNAEGETLWTRVYGGASLDVLAYAVDLTTNGDFVLAGCSYNAGLVLWTSESGDSIRSTTVSGCKFRTVRATSDGGCIAAGEIPNSGTITAVKFDSTGNVVWQRVYDGGSANSVDTSDGGYIIAGCSTDPDGLLIWVDANGENPRTRTYGDPSTCEEFWSLSVTSDGGYLLSDMATRPPTYDCGVYVVKTDANGDTMWTRVYVGPHSNQGQAGIEISDSNYAVAGFCGLDNEEAYDLVLGPVTPTDIINPPTSTPTTTIKLSPTIFSGTPIRIEKDAKLYDMLGRRVNAPSGNLAPGVYIYQYGYRLSKVIVTR